MCAHTPHVSGAGCAAEVDRRFTACSRPYLSKEKDAATFARCLGFVEPKVVDPAAEGALGRCDGPNITGRVSVAVGKPTPWEGAAPREIHGRSLYVASPIVTTADLRALRLEARGEDRFVVVELTSEGAKRLEQATAAHQGDFAVLGVNDWAIAARIGSPIPGPTLSIAVPGARVEDLCRAK